MYFPNLSIGPYVVFILRVVHRIRVLILFWFKFFIIFKICSIIYDSYLGYYPKIMNDTGFNFLFDKYYSFFDYWFFVYFNYCTYFFILLFCFIYILWPFALETRFTFMQNFPEWFLDDEDIKEKDLDDFENIDGDHFDKTYLNFLKERSKLKEKKWLVFENNLAFFEERKKKHLQHMDKYRFREKILEDIIDKKKSKSEHEQ